MLSRTRRQVCSLAFSEPTLVVELTSMVLLGCD
jgi:hypothetical protein